MRSRPARITIGALAWIVIGVAASTVFYSEKQIAQRRDALRAFDLHARETADTVADARSSQQAYVAAGQGVAFWMPKVEALLDSTAGSVNHLLQVAAGIEARNSLADAAATISDLVDVDKRARDYIHSGQTLMAADVVFTEGAENAVRAARQVEAARIAERQAFDAFEGTQRKFEAATTAGAAAFVAVIIAFLAFGAGAATDARGLAAPAASETAVAEPHSKSTLDLKSSADLRNSGDFKNSSWDPASAGLTRSAELALTLAPDWDSALSPEVSKPISQSLPTAEPGEDRRLKVASELCTELGRVTDLAALKKLLGRAAEMMDAIGLIVWMGSEDGADLRPMLAHGYSPKTLARMPAVPRAADNAAAAAYRTGGLQIVPPRADSPTAAIVAPMLSPAGCVGALAAEIKGGGETSEAVQSLAVILAAQLAGVLGGATPAASTENSRSSSQRRSG